MTWLDVLTVKEVSHFLRVKEKTIYRLIQNGKLPGFKVGETMEISQKRAGKLDK